MTDVSQALRQALTELSREKERLDRQIAVLEGVLSSDGFGGDHVSRGGWSRTPRRRRQMSAAQRRAVGKRMKAFWAKRRAMKQHRGGTPKQTRAVRTQNPGVR